MDKKLVYLSANEQKLICPEPFKIASGTVEYVEAHFELGDNWDSFDSIKAVWWSDFKTVGTILNSQGVCQVPYEVVIRRSEVMVNLVGSVAENDVLVERLTTFPVLGGTVLCDARVGGDDPHPATPSQVEQFAQRVHTDADRAETAATNAETSAQNASDSATSAHNSAESARDDKIAIEEAIAEVIQQIEDFEQVQVVVNTLPPSSQATSDFTDGVLTLGIPQGVKGDTGNGIQSIRKTGTSGLVDTYTITYTDGQTTTFTVTNGAKGDTGNGISSIAKTSTVGLVDTYTITYTNGNTTTFTVTNGEKGDKGDTGEVSLSELEDATVVQTLSDSAPYNYRRTNGGQGSGVREYDEIVGASVGWCQLVPIASSPKTQTKNNVTVTDNRDGTYTLQTTSEGASADTSIGIVGKFTVQARHKNLVVGVGGGASSTWYIFEGWHGRNYYNDTIVVYTTAGLNMSFDVVVKSGTVITTPIKVSPMVVDLTLMNSAIADYVYTLEQSTAGSGVTWLKTHFPRLFDNGYQPFDSGSIKSVSGLTAHEMVGVNQWNEVREAGGIAQNTGEDTTTAGYYRSEYISVMPQTSYYFTVPIGMMVFWYKADKTFISRTNVSYSGAYSSPSDAYYMRFRNITADAWNTYNNDICINLSDTSINGTYYPHESHTYPLDSSKTLRGKYVLDNGQLKAMGDVWKSVGQADRKYNEVDLGSLTWVKDGNSGLFYTAGIRSDAKYVGFLVCGKYMCVQSDVTSTLADKSMCVGNSQAYALLRIRDSAYASATASDFKTAMSGIKLVYEKATPTTETAPTYENPQWCDAHGTEEYIGSELPVGHNTDYPMTMVDCADGLGNGTYEARLTIANGVKTFTWQSV